MEGDHSAPTHHPGVAPAGFPRHTCCAPPVADSGTATSETSEEPLLAQRPKDHAWLAAALGRPNKSAELLDNIVDTLGYLVGMGGVSAGVDELVTSLLDEPELADRHLRSLAEFILVRTTAGGFGAPAVTSQLAAICRHAQTGQDTVVDTLWHSDWRVARAVGRSTGTLLPAAVVWVRARARAEADTWQHNVSYRHEQVAETAARWTALTADEPALAAFLATSSFHFTDENELLAAGRAVLSVPART